MTKLLYNKKFWFLIALVAFLGIVTIGTIVTLNNGDGTKVVSLTERKQEILQTIDDVYFDEENYEPENWDLIKDEITQAQILINLASDIDKLELAWVDIQEDLNAIPSISGIIADFETYKSTAIANVKASFVDTDYEIAELEKVIIIVTKFEEAMIKLENREDVDMLVSSTLLAIDEIVTIQDTATANENAFNSTKIDEKYRISQYMVTGEVVYYEFEQNKVDNIKAIASAEIDKVEYNPTNGIEKIIAIADKAIADIDSVDTKLELDNAFKALAVEEVKGSYVSANYYPEQLAEILTIIADFETKIADEEKQSKVTTAKIATIASIESVLNKAETDELNVQALNTAKSTATADITDYRADEVLDTVQLSAVNIAKNIAKSKVATATSIDDVAIIVEALKTEIDIILGGAV